MKKVYLFLANGFEEIEGLTVVDLLRRAQVQVVTVSITGEKQIAGSHGIYVQADELFENVCFDDADMLVLPGGEPGTTNLENCKPLCDLVKVYCEKGGEIAAICAAPRVFAGIGLLNGKKATSYPSVMERLTGAILSEEAVVVDGNITTSRGMGTAISFSLKLIEKLLGEETAVRIGKSIVYL